jgi:hypothetical protein
LFAFCWDKPGDIDDIFSPINRSFINLGSFPALNNSLFDTQRFSYSINAGIALLNKERKKNSSAEKDQYV